MSKLKSKLARLGAPRPQSPQWTTPVQSYDAETGEFVDASVTAPSAESVALEPQDAREPSDVAATVAGLPGEPEHTEQGPLRRTYTVFDAGHRHGDVAPTLALEARGSELAILALDPLLEGVDLSRALYLDTETTGLLGGAGTLPFLVGMAWFSGETLHVEQLLLERPGLEAPMLTRLRERMDASSVVVSFNGKSFDWPLLRTRFILQRVVAPKLPPHLDLLHCARRVYKRRLGSVRLQALERELLGFHRVGDIDGALIPELYLGYLRGRVEPSALGPIVEHNRSDLVALPALLGEIARRFAQIEVHEDARDRLGFATVTARAREHGRAIVQAEAAAESSARGELAPEALCLSAELKLRCGDIAGAKRAFEEALALADARSASAYRAHLALAKLYEHKLRAFADALRHAEAAYALEVSAEHAHRVERLKRKLGALLSH